MKHDGDQELVCGINIINEIISTRPSSILSLVTLKSKQNSRIKKLIDLAKSEKIKVSFKNESFFKKYFPGLLHQGVAILCRKRIEENESFIDYLLQKRKKILLLILDHLTDPHNVGACLRTSAAAGADAIIVPKNRACHLTSVVRKISSGGSELIPFVIVTNIVRTIKKLRTNGVKVLGASKEGGMNVAEIDLSECSTAFVIGSENKGLKMLTAKNCETLISIPMPGQLESLNASVSAGILLFEYLRQNKRTNSKL